MSSVVAVSYTHLDVYKRQPSTHSGSRNSPQYELTMSNVLNDTLGEWKDSRSTTEYPALRQISAQLNPYMIHGAVPAVPQACRQIGAITENPYLYTISYKLGLLLLQTNERVASEETGLHRVAARTTQTHTLRLMIPRALPVCQVNGFFHCKK